MARLYKVRNKAREALAFRIWQVAAPLDWAVSPRQLCAILDAEMDDVRAACRSKGWLGRLMPDEPVFLGDVA